MDNNLKTIALVVWWCEGSKLRRDKRWKNAYNYPVEVINSDPRIIKIFVDFLISLGIKKTRLRGQIQIHEGDDQEVIEQFWEKQTTIPRSQFNKTIVRAKGNKPGKNRGTFKIRLYDKTLFEELTNLLKEELLKINIGE